MWERFDVGFLLGMLLMGIVLVVVVIEPNYNKSPLHLEVKKVVDECEKSLPRVQTCKWVITAVPKYRG